MKKQWWHNKIAYQIYPKSFMDSNGDGIGDLQGIISKLDYLKDLGVDIIWMSPMFQSPCKDQGYDISDYYKVDPIFGNMDDMDLLIAEIKKRDMYLLLDLVINHCSSEHEWFQKALADPKGEYADYFYFLEGKDGNPPNNWRSYFGGSVWEKVPNSDLYYLHMFHKDQPDLNFENPIVREKIYHMMNWWLEKGIDGYRIDAIVNIKKDLTFQSYPPDREDGLVSYSVMLSHAKGLIPVLQDINKNTFQKHNALTVAELFNYDADEIEEYIGENGCFSTIFEFDTTTMGVSEHGWYDCKQPTAEDYKKTIFNCQNNIKDSGLICNIIENHDEPRGVSHYLGDTNDYSKKMLATIMMLNRGMPFLYQGQEIGMENKKFSSVKEIDDVSALAEYQVALSAGISPEDALNSIGKYCRDNARTPMQWSDEKNSGFSEGTPWLLCNENYRSINVKQQENQEDSVLSYYKKLISLRKNSIYENSLVWGTFQPELETEENIMAFSRKTENQTILVLANFQNKQADVSLPYKVGEILLHNYEIAPTYTSTMLLKPYESVVILCL